MFAKLFASKFGQLLVTAEKDDEDCPVLTLRVEINDITVSPSLCFSDTDTGWDSRDKVLEEMTLEQAEGVIESSLPDPVKKILGMEAS